MSALPTHREERAGDELRILLVEDNPGDARLVRELLRDVGQASSHETLD